jgi:hypothetical protein
MTNSDLKDAAQMHGKKVTGHPVIRWKRCYCGANEMLLKSVARPTRIRRPVPTRLGLMEKPPDGVNVPFASGAYRA